MFNPQTQMHSSVVPKTVSSYAIVYDVLMVLHKFQLWHYMLCSHGQFGMGSHT